VSPGLSLPAICKRPAFKQPYPLLLFFAGRRQPRKFFAPLPRQRPDHHHPFPPFPQDVPPERLIKRAGSSWVRGYPFSSRRSPRGGLLVYPVHGFPAPAPSGQFEVLFPSCGRKPLREWCCPALPFLPRVWCARNSVDGSMPFSSCPNLRPSSLPSSLFNIPFCLGLDRCGLARFSAFLLLIFLRRSPPRHLCAVSGLLFPPHLPFARCAALALFFFTDPRDTLGLWRARPPLSPRSARPSLVLFCPRLPLPAGEHAAKHTPKEDMPLLC